MSLLLQPLVFVYLLLKYNQSCTWIHVYNKNGNRSYLCNNLCNNISSRSSYDEQQSAEGAVMGMRAEAPAVVSGVKCLHSMVDQQDSKQQ